MRSPQLDALSYTHMRQQVKDVAVIQAALSVAFGRLVSPSDIDGSFPEFYRYALALMESGRLRGTLTADRYYAATRMLAGVRTPIPTLTRPTLDRARADTVLRVTGPVFAKRQIARGVPPEAALAAARGATLGAVKRLILEAPRNRIVNLSHKDDAARGWARVSDGDPCHFCAMLLSRGPAYSESTAGFEAHDGCGCSAEPVFRGQDGWNAQARKYSDLWEKHGDLNSFRAALAAPTD